jgi:phosphatidylserine/phosphatidylglycerophosphate/cardiolipin synthase-like enzyme
VTEALRAVSTRVLEDLARALEGRGVGWPPGVAELRRLGAGDSADALAVELARLAGLGVPAGAAGWGLLAVVREREHARVATDRLELVWTGPEVPGSRSRDTAVVVRELFASAERSVLVSTYAIHQGRQVFQPLAVRMGERPGLSVRVFVHVGRTHQDRTPENAILMNFATHFRREWPGPRLPDLYYDRRSLALDATERASLHAKCVIVDDRRSFVTSANFTEAAQERNLEAGVLVDDAHFAASLRAQFDALVQSGELRRLPV